MSRKPSGNQIRGFPTNYQNTNDWMQKNEINKVTYKSSRPGILPLRNRTTAPKPTIEDYVPNEINQRAEELISRFFLSNGLAYEPVENPLFKQFVKLINPGITLPTPSIMEACVEKLAFPSKPFVNYQRAIGPLTATVDIFRQNDEIFLSFSIHYFDDYTQRKNAIYLKKLILCEFDGDTIMTCVRRAINNFNYGNVRFTNLVTSNETAARQMYQTESVKHSYICFFTYLTRFIEEILNIEDFSRGLSNLRGFVLFIRKHSDLYTKFRRLQLSRNGDLDLPCLDSGKWLSTTIFLSRCLALHETFADFAVRWRLSTYINDDTYAKLSYLQRLLLYARRFAKELSTPESSVSQVVPTVVSIKCFIEQKSIGFSFDKTIKTIFAKHLKPLMAGYEEKRYDLACLLDPRYGYREAIYPLSHWNYLEKHILLLMEQENVMINEKNPSESVLLQPHLKQGRIEKVVKELELYRTIVSNYRPLASTNPFEWWGSRMMDMSNLFNKARELLAPPAVTINTEFYFGKHGKFSHMASRMNYQQLENALIVASQHEKFRGRGYCNNSPVPIFVPLTNHEPARKAAMANFRDRYPYMARPSGSPKSSSAAESSQSNILDAFDPMIMMEPPPEKRAKMEEDEKKRKLMQEGTKLEKNDTQVKVEVEESEQNQQSEVTKITVENSLKNPKIEQEKFVLKEVKEEPIDELVEEKPSKIEPEKRTRKIIKIIRQVRAPCLAAFHGQSSSQAQKFCPGNISKPQTTQKKNDELVVPKSESSPVKETQQLKRTEKCGICLQMVEEKDLKLSAKLSDIMVVLLGMIVDGKMSPSEAKYRYNKNSEQHICYRHFHDSRLQIFNALGVTNSDDIFNANQEKLKSVMDLLENLKGSQISSLEFKQLVILFAENYDNCLPKNENEYKATITFDSIFNDPKPPAEPKKMRMITMKRETEPILPKALRAPRKQVLTKDSEDEPIIRRIIHHKPWAVQSPAECEPSRYKNPGKCCYCQRFTERNELLKVPKSEERRYRWFEKLGDEFANRVKATETPFICRVHFSNNAFSSRGRLLRGMLPCTQDEVITYKMKGHYLSPMLSADCSSDDEEEKVDRMTATEKLVASIDKMQKDDSTSSSAVSNED